MKSAAGLLLMVYGVYNSVFYTVLSGHHIYSLVWAPGVFLVSFLILLTESTKTRQIPWLWVMLACLLIPAGSDLFFAGVFTRTFSGTSGYLVNDIFFTFLTFTGLMLIRRVFSAPLLPTDSHARVLGKYTVLIFPGGVASVVSILAVSLWPGLTTDELRQLFLSNILAFLLFGIPV
ncbi:hypothetical protein ACNJNU_05055 [Citrobacter freundii]|uniref:hypothetical protein n=1 Tax=Citrobacter freundii TaxID=546 RepID=UPI003A849CFB